MIDCGLNAVHLYNPFPKNLGWRWCERSVILTARGTQSILFHSSGLCRVALYRRSVIQIVAQV